MFEGPQNGRTACNIFASSLVYVCWQRQSCICRKTLLDKLILADALINSMSLTYASVLA